jgi:F-box and leucine-rich repeat protein GRR1
METEANHHAFFLSNCKLLTDASITSISINCTGLQSLYLGGCHKITDESIISISTHCIGLKRLNILGTKITDASLIAIAKKCNRIQLLNAYGCDGLSSRELSRGFKSVSKLRAVLLSIDPSLPI